MAKSATPLRVRKYSVRCSVLQALAVCCRVLQGVAGCCRANDEECSALARVAGNAQGLRLQHAATRYNTLQSTATHCNAMNNLFYTERQTGEDAATHCNTLQHTATHCNTLQRTEYPPLYSVTSWRRCWAYRQRTSTS